jgi:hypothetical protein
MCPRWCVTVDPIQSRGQLQRGASRAESRARLNRVDKEWTFTDARALEHSRELCEGLLEDVGGADVDLGDDEEDGHLKGMRDAEVLFAHADNAGVGADKEARIVWQVPCTPVSAAHSRALSRAVSAVAPSKTVCDLHMMGLPFSWPRAGLSLTKHVAQRTASLACSFAGLVCLADGRQRWSS